MAVYSVLYQCANWLFEYNVNIVAVSKMEGSIAVVHGPFCLCNKPIILPDHNVVDSYKK